jgi:hypothetical protein
LDPDGHFLSFFLNDVALFDEFFVEWFDGLGSEMIAVVLVGVEEGLDDGFWEGFVIVMGGDGEEVGSFDGGDFEGGGEDVGGDLGAEGGGLDKGAGFKDGDLVGEEVLGGGERE